MNDKDVKYYQRAYESAVESCGGAEFDQTRDLSEFAVAYFCVHGVAELLHAGMPREAYCAREDWRKVSLHLTPGSSTSHLSDIALATELKFSTGIDYWLTPSYWAVCPTTGRPDKWSPCLKPQEIKPLNAV